MKVFTAMAMLATAAVLGAGCGGGGGSDTSDSGSSNGSNQQGARGQTAELRDCLKQHGIELPEGAGPGGGQPPAGGQPPPDGEFPPPGSGQNGQGPPQGLDNSKMRKALQECGADAPRGGFGNRNSPEFKKSIRAYVSCVRRNGYDLPDPNLSGDGPVFDSDKVDQNDADFQKASQKCQDRLRQPQNSQN